MWPQINVELSDNYPPDEVSQSIANEPRKYRLCVATLFSGVHCSPLLSETPRLLAGECQAHSVISDGALMLEVWLENSEVEEPNRIAVTRLSMNPSSPIFNDGYILRSLPQIRHSTPIEDLFKIAQRASKTNDYAAWDILDGIVGERARDFICANGRPAKILVIGDSHIQQYVNGNVGLQSNDGSMCTFSNYCHCGVVGATAHGVNNYSSSSGASASFRECLSIYAEGLDVIAISLGEVDARNLAKLRGVTPLSQIKTSVDRLFHFIRTVLMGDYNIDTRKIVLLGAPYLCPQESIDPQASHHAVTRINSEFRRRCAEEGVCAVANPGDDLFDLEKGVVREYFWSTPPDMHCSPKRTFYFWHRAIKEAAGLEWCSGLQDL